jgi:hypothetical protein
MKYEVIKACVVKGKGLKFGEIIELDDSTATQLMGIGRVVPADETKLEDRSIGLEVSESKPKRRSRKKAEPESVEETAGDE